ncbi:enoyl-CoA hydratase-related protein [Bacillus sp. JCM 19041]|uniref:enoyl-CoA hydratase-related protein n=1 Tax=Bacillus sp. JCM 19041 TaxID=1460637 RepID=UPI0006D2B7AF
MDIIKYLEEDGVATIALNRPDSYNALTARMLSELKQAFKKAESSSDVRCIVLTGNGKGFCSGQDLKEVSGDVDHGEMIRTSYAPVIKQMKACEKPIVAAVNGVAAGAGFSLALACDFRLMHEQASFVNAFIHVGLVPDSGNLLFLSRLIGEAKALELAVLGKKVHAEEALNLGLATKVIKEDEWELSSRQFATKLAAMPTQAIALIKRSLKLAHLELDAYLAHEADMQRIAGKTVDHHEGVEAFKQKRKPVFTGR